MDNKLIKKISKHKTYLFLCIFCIYASIAVANTYLVSDTVFFKDVKHEVFIGNSVKILKDETNNLTIKDIIRSTNFISSNQNVPSFGITSASFWLSFKIKNVSNQGNLLIEIPNPLLDEIEFYTLLPDGSFFVKKMGEYQPFSFRGYNHPSYIFNLKIPKNSTCQYYFKFKSTEDMSLPIKLGSFLSIMDSLRLKDLLFGIYVGIMMVMFLYNTFIFTSTKDRSYLYYIIYILFVSLTQICLQGYAFQYLWPDSSWLAEKSVVLLGVFSGISAGEFARSFLNTRITSPKLSKFLNLFYISYAVCILLSLFSINSIPLVNMTALLISLHILFIGIIVAKSGNRSAKFFLTSWIIFLLGVIIFALKNAGILPYNNFTNYTMPAGSALEAILLSFALADRINILKKEKEQSQLTTLLALQENEKLITEQNVVLENKVEKRTMELKHTNEELNTTLSNLKNTQTQLVSVEKMASLGQLTAGIAHEINNPINFVSANVKPLKMDIDDVLELVKKYEVLKPNEMTTSQYNEIQEFRKEIDIDYLKKEMDSLLSGIEDGAKRTAEIVSGLKNFSRLDESDLKEVNINEGIQSTLILLKSAIPAYTEVIVNLGDIPKIECFPGKLNQVFMNLFVNALYAIAKKESQENNKLIIVTYELDNQIYISIEDTGIGMKEEVKAKIFEPFFTTKPIGEGTGLGMSIVFQILESHHAKLEIESEYGVGTKMLLILNKRLNLGTTSLN